METNKLPVEAYTDKAFFDLEMQHLFTNVWTFAGLVEDIHTPGDYMVVNAGKCSIFVLMQQDGSLSAFHNQCRHRGMPLLHGKGRIDKKLTCPYHDWTYSQQGELKSLPKLKQEFPDLDKACFNLKPANVGIWRGMIWIHPSQTSPSLSDWFATMDGAVAPYNVEDLIEYTDYIVIEEVNANWKLVVENYIDHYHLAQLHSGTLSMYDHKKAEFGFKGQHFHFWEPLEKSYQATVASSAPLPLLMPEKHPKLGAWVPMLFPCTGLAESESSWSVFHIEPLTVDKSRIVIRTKGKNSSMISYLKQSTLSYRFWHQKTKAKDSKLPANHPLGSADFMQEDIYVCEQVQKSLNTPGFEFGPSANHGELPLREFQSRIMEIIGPHFVKTKT